jgi:hypothetical protein
MRQLGRFVREKATVIILVALVAGSLWALMAIPPREVGWIKTAADVKREELENEARKTIIQVVGGAFAIFALILTLRRVVVAEQGHITDRYTKAIDQLGRFDGDKPNIEVRLGGIYALERIARDSPRDHWAIMEVLTAYVRRNAPALDNSTEGGNPRTDAYKPDIQAIMGVLLHRRARREVGDQNLDLRATDLKWAYLPKANLERANLWKARLQGAVLEGAHLKGAFLFGVHLERAALDEGDFEEADLSEAHLERASLRGANLKGASLGLAHLEGAFGLTPEQVKSARFWQLALYDPGFRMELGLSNPAPTKGMGDGGQVAPNQ